MFVKPGPHPTEEGASLKVRLCHARARFLSPDGEEVPETQDWHRAVARGDVAPAERPAPAAEPTATEGSAQ